MQGNYSTYESFEDASGNETIIPPKKETNEDVVDVAGKIIQDANLYILAILLIVYIVVFIGFGMYIQRDGQSQEKSISTTFDVVMFGSLFGYAIYKYVRMEDTEKDNVSNTLLSSFIGLYDNDLSVYSIMIFVICFYLLIFLLRIPRNENKPVSVLFIEGVSWLLLATLVIHILLKYFFNFDILDSLRNKDYSKYLENVMDSEVDASGNLVDASGNPIDLSGNEPEPKPEVFNVSNNLYTYDDAQAICKSMDSRLATYDEIETAYNNGAEWCTYGWSDGQLALFPTQKETWNKLQSGDCKKKNSCGRPGVNGGYFQNPNIKFGVNCFGIKPKAKDIDNVYMEVKQDDTYPRTAEDQKMIDKIEYYKNNSENILVNSFNREKWSRY